ncbi:MAG: 2-oxoacid:acceptor oxidoreductase family protein [Gammaproteobacteria bacterium]|nr:2-oxoacid:acceptor oxidoreductase family protein [Gammaproteobacteria bacterium]
MAEMEIRLSGSGGQGILLAGRILGEALTMNGLKVAQSQSYEPTSRGGLSRSDLVVSDHAVDYPLVSVLDYLVVLDKIAAGASDALLKSATLVIVDRALEASWRATRGQLLFLPIAESARRLGNIRSTNMFALGACWRWGISATKRACLPPSHGWRHPSWWSPPWRRSRKAMRLHAALRRRWLLRGTERSSGYPWSRYDVIAARCSIRDRHIP